MNKFEILFKLSDTADRLESAGLLREAIVLTNVMKRMADVVQPWDEEEPDYTYAIQGVAANILNNRSLAQSIYNEYVNEMNRLIAIPNNPNKSELTKRLKAFELQTKKLESQVNEMPGYQLKNIPGTKRGTGIENNSLANQINYYGLERARDLNDFNRRWQLYMNEMKKTKFRNVPNSKTTYDMPGMQQYFANLYEQLKLKYIK